MLSASDELYYCLEGQKPTCIVYTDEWRNTEITTYGFIQVVVIETDVENPRTLSWDASTSMVRMPTMIGYKDLFWTKPEIIARERRDAVIR